MYIEKPGTRATRTFFVCRNNHRIPVLIAFRLGRACTLAVGYNQRSKKSNVSAKSSQISSSDGAEAESGWGPPASTPGAANHAPHPAKQRRAK